MADDFQLGSGNWWEASRNRFESGTTVPAPISTTLNTIASFGGGSNMVLQGGHEQSGGGGGGAGVMVNPNLQMMGLGLSSQAMDWNQALMRGAKPETSFRSMLQGDINSNTNNLQQETPASSSQEHWRQKLYSGGVSSDGSSANEFKQINRGFSLDQHQFNSQASSSDSTIASQHNLTASYQVDSAAAYGLLLSENQTAFENRQMNYGYPPSSYGSNAAEMMPSWNKYQQSPPPGSSSSSSHLHFTNNTPFWNASSPPVNDARSGFFPALQDPIPTAQCFDEKPKITPEIRDFGRTAKKNSPEMSSKRPRNETPSPLPAFKVRKEKMGDRITALQQLVSPFGKTDTASVLSEAIEYIKLLHEQVSVLSTPYMKNRGPIQHQQNSDKSKLDPAEGPGQDLRSRGLCLVPVSSTFPMTHETTVDFWTPTFGGTFR